jgi:starch synthase
MKILFATPECAPYVKTGGLGDVSGALPAALAALGHDVRVLLPAYRGMKVTGEVGDSVELPAQGPWPAAQLLPVRTDNGVTLLLLACPSLYQRAGGPYVDQNGSDHVDNALRFAFLSRIAAQLGTIDSPCKPWRADVVHANDWPTGLAPLYLAQARSMAPQSEVAASIVTIHNVAFQGVFPMHMADVLGIPLHWRGMDGVEFFGQVSMLKAALQFANVITTVSPSYAREVQTDAFGAGLDGVLRANAGKLVGILNGIDTRTWNPEQDKLIAHRFTRTDMAGKALDKEALQARCGLEQDAKAMLFAVVSRLTSQKGIDLVLQGLPALLSQGSQLVVLGQGEPSLHDALKSLAHRHPKQVSVTFGFNEPLAHQIEAGADVFLMPSRFEPCGLNQMYSQAYGTPPIVTPVGGLADSVTDATRDPAHGTGFVMERVDAASFAAAAQRAMAAWREPPRWRRIQSNGMARHFGWEESAAQYVEMYERALRSVGARTGATSQ